ncbi:MAG: DUF4143 domain-containing protein [Chitinivibrionales bacterium]|nr:DUF4143 domain-containing protein [Chitinivibrionales bacterium]MBD3394383.1 DUF4143 domain-containing protein [Chitinivibrionales bacterium]
MRYLNRLFSPAQQSFFLFGPRGTGKSTWLAQAYSEAILVNLLDGASYRAYLANPERLETLLKTAPEEAVCIIDEIQRAPNLLPVVHKLIEDGAGVQFILTGSSARKLRRGGVDLLGGRATVKTMHPFLAAELGSRFDLDQSLTHGMLPLVRAASDPAEVLDGYISLYLEQEVRAEGLVRNIEDFARFLEVMSFSHGSLVNVAEIARECEAKRTTVNGYLSILEDLLIGRYVPVFSRRAKRELVAHRKFYYFDCGVYASLRPFGPLDKRDNVAGPALEGLVYQHLRAWLEYGKGNGGKLYFWRTRSGLEVDFVVYGEGEFWAIEVKNSERVRPKDLNGLAAFHEDYPEARRLLLYRGADTLSIKGVTCMPADKFLHGVVPGRPLPGDR